MRKLQFLLTLLEIITKKVVLRLGTTLKCGIIFVLKKIFETSSLVVVGDDCYPRLGMMYVEGAPETNGI